MTITIHLLYFNFLFYIFKMIDRITCNDVGLYLWYSVFAFKSSMSTFGKPLMSNSSSCSLKMDINRLGMMS